MTFTIDGYEFSLTEDGCLHIEDTVETGDDGIVVEFPFDEVFDAITSLKTEYDKLELPNEDEDE
jgi:hypothetical protein